MYLFWKPKENRNLAGGIGPNPILRNIQNYCVLNISAAVTKTKTSSSKRAPSHLHTHIYIYIYYVMFLPNRQIRLGRPALSLIVSLLGPSRLAWPAPESGGHFPGHRLLVLTKKLALLLVWLFFNKFNLILLAPQAIPQPLSNQTQQNRGILRLTSQIKFLKFKKARDLRKRKELHNSFLKREIVSFEKTEK